jgi:glycosyltransferase involved in cell wall biosynthesis
LPPNLSLSNLKLGIISDARHYYDREGKLYALSILTRQFEQWARLFSEVTICAPLIEGAPPNTHSCYPVENIRLLPVASAGGDTPRAKLDLLLKIGPWWRALHALLRQVDAIHIRCPNNISIPGLAALALARHPRHAVYTGNWLGYPGEPATYRAQRLYLKLFFRGPVAAYGEWPGQPAHVVSSFSPSYSQADWETEGRRVTAKLERLAFAERLPEPVVLLNVGALNRNKNQQLVIRGLRLLRDRGVSAELHLAGDGSERDRLAQLAQALDVTGKVIFHGDLSHAGVGELYRRADFVVQPSITEGYSKVVVEAMLHGAIPILSDVSTNPQIIAGGRRGRCFNPEDDHNLASHVLELAGRPDEMARLIVNCRQYAQERTLEAWREHLRQTLQAHWH